VPRPPRPDDLYRLRVATDPTLSPDGRSVAVSLETVGADYDQYRAAIWLVPTEGGGRPRQVTIGARRDAHPRFSPDGRTLAFLSDRRPLIEDEPTRPSDAKDREDVVQVYGLPLDGGEARRLTDLPRGVRGFEWSPDGSRLVVLSSSHAAIRDDDLKRRGLDGTRPPGTPPPSDFRFIDRLDYMLNGAGFTYDHVDHLWLVDVATGDATRLTDGRTADHEPAWSPDGKRIAFVSVRRRDADLFARPDVHVVDVATQVVTPITAGPDSFFGSPAWLPDGRSIVALGNRLPARAGSRNDIWHFSADGSDATPTGGRNLSARHDLMPGAGMTSDVTHGEAARLVVTGDGRSVLFTAPIAGAYELWRLDIADGAVARLTSGHHYLSGWDAATIDGRGRTRVAYLRSTPTEPPDVWVLDGIGARAVPHRRSSFNKEALSELTLVEPIERHVTVDGQDVQGWLLPAGRGARPLVTEIHGGPHAFYGWSPVWEFQVLAANGMSVFYSNPRGSEGYGEAFNDGNHRDWGHGPMRDVIAGVDALVADGLADAERLGVTGGSYGGYLTSWIVGHDQRFKAAMTCRSVNDMGMLFLTGDISGGDWATLEFDAPPWDAPEYYREISPLTYARAMHTPLLIQHSERDLRTTIGQAEALFTVLRSLRRPVRLLRVPEETHELTRSGTPFRRIENLSVVTGWFRHFLVDGKRTMPPLPRIRGGR
jgi:dipeptidyl aminopeptidase/acylaminoacyl peptidase